MNKNYYTFSFRKRFAIGMILATIFFTISCLIATYYLKHNHSTADLPESSQNITNNVKTSTQTKTQTYVIKNYEGKISVFEKGKSTPFRVTDTLTSKLPQKDQEILQNGIEVNSQKDVSNILEDFCS